jgi:hypothetical protein
MEGKNQDEVLPKKCHTVLFEGRPQLYYYLQQHTCKTLEIKIKLNNTNQMRPKAFYSRSVLYTQA